VTNQRAGFPGDALQADENDRDYAALQAAVKDGRAEATSGI
jgi:hypothetical protein